MNGGNGLEEISEQAFSGCTLLHEITIPPAIRVVKEHIVSYVHAVNIVTLGKGLEEIGMGAFLECTSLREIMIPTAVKAINDGAFMCFLLAVDNCEWWRGAGRDWDGGI